ncbi:GtrA family protein [Streptomyces candidus]|uniref:Putative flippase GtrA n=1 Tax=Streptomyces candidus TaxID=67283 RepID=A0A7X0HF52_9ACTN|nr:GtrA family protein [Streptomyces candidus]MBB6435038.1 putative flippase GtrA [Streptomyces candidus]GHH40959.1 membrane protein [Streptomyces candidus]
MPRSTPDWSELRSFAAVGGCAYLVDLALFVWFRGPLDWDPLAAKAVAFLAGCTVAYAGNALGTYRHSTAGDRAAGTSRLRRYGVFLAVNAAGAAVQLTCLAVSHHGLGLTSPRADALSGSVIGMALATCLRFWGTRTLVFRTHRQAGT